MGARPWREPSAFAPDGSLIRRTSEFLSVAALPTSIIAWAAGIAGSSLQLTGHGLVAGLHPLWYAGTLLGVVGMLLAIATRKHWQLLMVYAFTLAVLLSATGVLLERGPRFPYIFTSYAYAEDILRNRAIDYGRVYLSWPGWHLVSAMAVGSSRIEPAVLLTWAPLGLLVITLAALMALFRRYRLPRSQLWVALALSATALLGPVYPVPAGLALIMVVFAVSLLLEAYVGQRRGMRARIGLVLLLAALVPTHLLTSLVGILAIGATSVLIVGFLRRRAGPATVLGVVFLGVYLFYIATEVTTQLLPGQIATVVNIDRLFGSIATTTASAISSGSPEHVEVVRVRIGYVIALAALGVLGLLTTIARRTDVKRWVLQIAWLAGGLASLGVGGYGGEILARGSTLAAPGSIALASWLATLRVGRVLLASAMLAAVTFSPVFLYGNEVFDYVRPAELAADAVLDERHPQEWSLERASRTWYREIPREAGKPAVTVYGPLYDRTSGHIGVPDSPPMPYWSYDNGEVRIMVVRADAP